MGIIATKPVTNTAYLRLSSKAGHKIMRRILPAIITAVLLCAPAYAQIIIDTSGYVKTNKQLYSVVVSQNDRLTFQQYFNGKAAGDLMNNQSLTKSVMSLLIGIAIDKGYIPSVDEKIVTYFSQLKQDSDKRKQQITIRQIMNQASGLWHENLLRLDQYFA
ncbi:MAG TPA: hypothetical protein VHC47_10755, partial [Mucilaginibacter sp.]|nr:hypothetical protein [Mucilaginibacter sp.]